MRKMSIRVAALCLFVAGASVWAADTPKPVKVFILAGQSNMEGKAKVALLKYQTTQPATRDLFKHLHKDGNFIERDDVWIKFLDRKGKLTVGYGSPGCIGPELEFGNVVGDRYDEQVLLIKAAWGGRSLYRDFRSPSAGLPPADVLEKMLAGAKAKQPATTMDDIKATFGATYREMLAEVNGTLANLKTLFPQYQSQGYEIAGFFWFQGWNDMINAEYTAQHTANLVAFIRDVRKDLKAPNMPFVIAQMGVDGVKAEGSVKEFKVSSCLRVFVFLPGVNAERNVKKFKDAQAAVMQTAEFKGNVALVKTDVFWDTEAEAVFKKGWREHMDEWNKVGSDWGFHYLGSAKTMCAIGKACGEAMLELRGDKK